MGEESIITVYHGGTEPIEHPLVSAGRPGLDFGQGFYVTAMRDQAELWADRMARLFVFSALRCRLAQFHC